MKLSLSQLKNLAIENGISLKHLNGKMLKKSGRVWDNKEVRIYQVYNDGYKYINTIYAVRHSDTR